MIVPWSSEDRDIMRDIYLLVSQHPDPANTEEYWQSLIDDVGGICRKYNGHPLAVHFGCAVMEYWELVCEGSYDLKAKKVIDYGIPKKKR